MKALTIEMQPVESSNIEAVGHDPATNTLRVQFKSGAAYDYPDVPAQKHQALMDADSIGGHFHRHIKSKHVGRKVAA